jgi:ferric-dicitrate binding protein FerR (iron transport regulator)
MSLARHSSITVAAGALLWLLLVGSPALSQAAGCTVTAAANPPRDVLTCADGLTITAERGTAYRLLDRNRDGRPEGAQLNDRGLLISLPEGGGRGRFQIHTPHAIASVRGTIFAVDVGGGRTSVFVERGVVSARPQRSRQAVTLRAGDGVDIDAATVVPQAKRWSAERAAALLARFGR